MSKGSNPTNVTTTTSSEPSDFVKPYVTEAFDQAQNLFQSSTPNFYPNQTYTNFAPQTEAALKLAQTRALNNPLLGSSQTEVNKILQGDYLDPSTNKYSQQLYNQIAGDVTSGVQSQFAKGGRLGSGANQEILARELGKVGTQVYGDQYNRERENMMNATEDMEMAKIQDAMSRFDFQQQQPYYKLREYLGSIGANVPTNTMKTQPVYRNTGAGILGGISTGANIGTQIPGLGAGLGAIGGGLLGGFA